MQKDRLLTPEEVAEMLGVKVETLRTWRSCNILRGPNFFKIGSKKVMYKLSDVDDFLKKGKRDIEEQKLSA